MVDRVIKYRLVFDYKVNVSILIFLKFFFNYNGMCIFCNIIYVYDILE